MPTSKGRCPKVVSWSSGTMCRRCCAFRCAMEGTSWRGSIRTGCRSRSAIRTGCSDRASAEHPLADLDKLWKGVQGDAQRQADKCERHKDKIGGLIPSQRQRVEDALFDLV